ncbi:MAG: hypothetical protein ACKO6N_18965 [Myxococcota bacterium]
MPTLKQLVRDALIPALAAPAIAEAGDINTGISLLKRSVVSYLNTHHPAPKEVIAPYLGKSVRWLYRMMEPEERQDEDRQPDRLQKLIFLHMRRTYPEWTPISELHAYLRRCRLRYPRNILESLMDFHVGLGFIERSPEDPSLYRATERLTQTNPRNFRDRKQDISDRSVAIYPIAEAYIRSDQGTRFELYSVRLSAQKAEVVAQEIQNEIRKVLDRVAAESGDGEASIEGSVAFNAMFLCSSEAPKNRH